MQDQQPKTLLGIPLASWLPVAVLAVGGIVAFAELRSEVRHLQKEQDKQETTNKETAISLQAIDRNVTEVKTLVKELIRARDRRENNQRENSPP